MIGRRNISRAPGRRGSIYLATLGATMIVTVIGLSALLAMRVRNREHVTTAAAAKIPVGKLASRRNKSQAAMASPAKVAAPGSTATVAPHKRFSGVNK